MSDEAGTDPAAGTVVTVVAVHGNGGGGERFALASRAMPIGTRLVAPTLPGFSTRPRDPSLTTVAGYADHLAGELQTIAAADGRRRYRRTGSDADFAVWLAAQAQAD